MVIFQHSAESGHKGKARDSTLTPVFVNDGPHSFHIFPPAVLAGPEDFREQGSFKSLEPNLTYFFVQSVCAEL